MLAPVIIKWSRAAERGAGIDDGGLETLVPLSVRKAVFPLIIGAGDENNLSVYVSRRGVDLVTHNQLL